MCDICKELVACPVGEKRNILIEDPSRGMIFHDDGVKTFTDAYGKKCYMQGPLFHIDKYHDHTECSIGTHIWDENYVNYGSGVDNIRYCPFCGEKLVKEESNNEENVD